VDPAAGNQQRDIPLEIARGFSSRLRKLAGFGLSKRLLGRINKCSPEDLLDGTGPRPIVASWLSPKGRGLGAEFYDDILAPGGRSLLRGSPAVTA
jgi:hypothetical protein